ncbi:MAG: CBS domain-containing protein [Methanothrix sp.]|nr:CBS domain-containing protein [Methanothrix sp.]
MNISPPDFKSIPVAINPHHSAKSASVIIYENNIDRLAVVERGSIQRLIGMVTRTDAIRAYKERDKTEPERSTEQAA